MVTRAAVVGVGYLGTFHAEKYRRSKRAELTAVVDTSEQAVKKVSRKNRAQALTNFRELPALGVQCASVATPTTSHFDVAKWLMENGIDVLIEKPITVRMEEAEELIATAERCGRILQVGHLERFNPAFKAVQERLDSPRFFEARRIASFTGRGHDVDVVMDLMIHDIDIIAHLVGRPLKRVEAVGIPILTNTVDIANARLTFEGGAVANVSASRAAFHSERTVRIFQPDLYISLDFGKKRLKMVSKRSDALKIGGLPDISVEEQKVEERDALEDEIDAFLTAVEERSRPIVSGEDGLRALQLAERIKEAFAASLAEIDDERVIAQYANIQR